MVILLFLPVSLPPSPKVSKLSAEEMERNVLYGVEGTYANRWLDKWAIIVTQDGSAGLNWEHSMLDGHTMMEFVAVRGMKHARETRHIKS